MSQGGVRRMPAALHKGTDLLSVPLHRDLRPHLLEVHAGSALLRDATSVLKISKDRLHPYG